MFKEEQKENSFIASIIYYESSAVAQWLVHSVTRLSCPGSRPGRGHCVVFLGKTLHSHSVSVHPGV